MTNRRDDVTEQIRQTHDTDQDMFAAILHDELAYTERWRTTFATTQGQLDIADLLPAISGVDRFLQNQENTVMIIGSEKK